jgi:enamine deaminase RidA (YjgF/YER057c/UK114 family)
MTGRITARLQELGITLPEMVAPVANYVPFVVSGKHLFISGQITVGPDKTLRHVGIVGKEIALEEARDAARLAAVNVLAVAQAALDGDLDRVARVVKITGFVNAIPGFTQHPEVVNGASDLFVEVFGEAGRHARAAVGAGSLPRNVCVEVEALFEIV